MPWTEDILSSHGEDVPGGWECQYGAVHDHGEDCDCDGELDAPYCQRCGEALDEDDHCTYCHPEPRLPYRHTPGETFYTLTGRSYGDDKCWDDPFYGVEIEAEAASNRNEEVALVIDNMPRGLFEVKSDTSLSYGAEFVSQPMTLAYAQSLDWSPFDHLREQGWRAWDTGTAGMHVHISRQAFHKPTGLRAAMLPLRPVNNTGLTPRQLRWIAARESELRELMTVRCESNRRIREYRANGMSDHHYPLHTQLGYRTSYTREIRRMRARIAEGPPAYREDLPIRSCEPSEASAAHIYRFGHLILSNPVFFQRFAGRRGGSYSDFDCQSLFDFKGRKLKDRVGGTRYVPINLTNTHTIEVRIFRGTIRPNRILANLEMVAGCVAYTRNMTIGEVAAGGLHYRALCEWLMAREATYPHVCELLDDQTHTLHLTGGPALLASSVVEGYECAETKGGELLCVS
jgi:hypothetical protein